ncbi:MAG: histidine kinase dimerization/phospho-acceptor domain-containing protein [Fidelibacterota bacterium]
MRNNEVNIQKNKIVTNNSGNKATDLEIIHQFAATVNHEINNPLTAIIGQAEISEIAYKNGMEETLCQALQNIIKEAQKIRQITEKLENLDDIKTEDYAGYTKILNLT